MSSYENGIWVHENAGCPSCCATRLKQGFKLPDVLGEYCAPCVEERALAAYYLSIPYLAWKASYDAFVATLPAVEPMTMTPNPELEAWLVSFPQPSRSS
jgi:hypothetical protein